MCTCGNIDVRHEITRSGIALEICFQRQWLTQCLQHFEYYISSCHWFGFWLIEAKTRQISTLSCLRISSGAPPGDMAQISHHVFYIDCDRSFITLNDCFPGSIPVFAQDWGQWGMRRSRENVALDEIRTGDLKICNPPPYPLITASPSFVQIPADAF